MKTGIEATTRYGSTFPEFDSKVCDGDCEGTGMVPTYRDDENKWYKFQWLEAESKGKSGDGCHFVKCEKCGGSGYDLSDVISKVYTG